MQVNINASRLGAKQLWNQHNEKYCTLGAVCKQAGVEDDEMNHRVSIVFKPGEKTPARDLPEDLKLFFVEDTSWNPVSESYKGSRKFKANTLGQKVIDLNDSRPDGWQDQMVETLALGGVELVWEVDQAAE